MGVLVDLTAECKIWSPAVGNGLFRRARATACGRRRMADVEVEESGA